MIIKSKNIDQVIFSYDFKSYLKKDFEKLNNIKFKIIVFYDQNLENQKIYTFLKKNLNAYFIKISIKDELSTEFVNKLTLKIKKSKYSPNLLIGIGGGTVLDCTKAVSVLLTNRKKAEQYQGWDLLENKGIFTIGIPSISGTGAESSRTCVLLNKKKKLKLGFNSKYTCFNKIYLFPEILKSVPKKQLLITATDAYFHSFELLNGKKRNKHADSLAKNSLKLIKNYLKSKDLKNSHNLKKLMLSSFFAGEAISFSMVGLVHPFSAALSSVFNTPHCLANCIVFRGLKEYYINEYEYLNNCLINKKIIIENKTKINKKNMKKLFESTLKHQKPLKNHLGSNYKKILTFDKVTKIFESL